MATPARKTTRKGTRRSTGAKRRTTTSARSARKPAQWEKAAEFLGMNPKDVSATAQKLRKQTREVGQKVRVEMEKLGKRADELTERFDGSIKEGVKKVEQLADEVARGLAVDRTEVASRLEHGVDRMAREATRLANEANREAKRMFDQARMKLEELINKRKPMG